MYLTTIKIFAVLALTMSCASTKISGMVAERCGANSPVMASDMETFGFLPAKNKVIVMRVFATWCPYCKDDLKQIGELFKRGEWKPEDIQIYLMSYKNKRENHNTYLEFIRGTFPSFNIPLDAAQIVYVDKDYSELVKTKNIAGKTIFEGWQGVPYGLVYGKDGRLVFRGHFTQGPSAQDAHYAFITKLSKETCGQPR